MVFLVLTGLAVCAAGAPPSLIPKPTEITTGEGVFQITPETKIVYSTGDPQMVSAAEYLAGRLSLAMGKQVTAKPTSGTTIPSGGILLTTAKADAKLGGEGYSLTISKSGVVIRAPKEAGAFYGGITLLQLAPPAAFRAPAMVEGVLGGKVTVKARYYRPEVVV